MAENDAQVSEGLVDPSGIEKTSPKPYTKAVIGEKGPEKVVPLKKVNQRKPRPAWEKSGPMPSGGVSGVVKRVQEIVGAPLTGKLDRPTSNAVRAWQINAGLPVTGRVDEPTRRAMGL